MNYFISYYDHSAAKWPLWFDWKERAQDRECLRCKHKGNEYKHCCEFHARRFYENQLPFIILLRDLPAQVLKTLLELETEILRRDAHLFLTIRGRALRARNVIKTHEEGKVWSLEILANLSKIDQSTWVVPTSNPEQCCDGVCGSLR